MNMPTITDQEAEIAKRILQARKDPEALQRIINEELTQKEAHHIHLYFQLARVPQSKRWFVGLVVNFAYVLSKVETYLYKKYSRMVFNFYLFRVRLRARFSNKKDGLS